MPTKVGPSAQTRVAPLTVAKRIGHFVLHFVEMCAPMCIGFAVGDVVYFWLAGLGGYSEPFRELPYLSVVVITFSMTAPMTAWMLYRGMPHRAVVEMSAAMPAVAIILLGLGWVGALAAADLAVLEHGLMMPAMVIPMLMRPELYAGRAGHAIDSGTRLAARDHRTRTRRA
jgi:hypothetical protein